MGSLRKKYIFAGCSIIMVFLAVLLLLSGVLKESLVEDWNRRKMDTLAGQVISHLEEKKGGFSQEDIENLGFENNIFITVTDENFNILATTSGREASQQRLSGKSSKIVQEQMETLAKTGKSFSSNFDDNNKALFVQINQVPGWGYVILKKSLTGLNSSMRVMETCYALAALLTLILGIPAIIYLSGKMVQPIRDINKVTKQISQLNFQDTVRVNSKDELGTLAESVNLMSDKLEEALGNLKKDVELRNDLVRNMAHELKTPTAVIMGYAENMPYISRRHPEKLEKYCSVISEECERMDSIIQQMLEVSAYECGESVLNKEHFSAQALLEGVSRFLRSDHPDWNGTYEEVNEVKSEIFGDYEALRRALYNYVKNAVRYGRKDGLIRIHAWEDEEWIRFSVFNQGEPIPEKEQENIWNVFYKINPARTREQKSFGIGLSIVKQAAKAHGGDVRVQNVEGGVEFSLFIGKI